MQLLMKGETPTTNYVDVLHIGKDSEHPQKTIMDVWTNYRMCFWPPTILSCKYILSQPTKQRRGAMTRLLCQRLPMHLDPHHSMYASGFFVLLSLILDYKGTCE